MLRSLRRGCAEELIVRNSRVFRGGLLSWSHGVAMKVVSRDILTQIGCRRSQTQSQWRSADLRRGQLEILAACKLYKADAEIRGRFVSAHGS